MPHFKEFFEVFFGTRIQTRGVEWDLEPFCELGTHHHPHIIAVGTLFSSFWSMFDSTNPCEKITHIIRSLDIGDIFYLTYSDECLIAFIVFRFWLNIWIVPKTYHIIFITQLEYGHGDIWPTTDMDENFWFLLQFWSIETMFEDIPRNLIRKSLDDKLRIFLEKCLEGGMLGNDVSDFCRRYIRNMRISEKFIVRNSEKFLP
jgi:hypothetical protein